MTYHVPVMVNEVLDYLSIRQAGIYVDCTVGGGGHAEAILTANEKCRVIGLDVDPDAILESQTRLAARRDRLTLVRANFDRLHQVLAELGLSQVDGILFDLGVSLHHLTSGCRGFGYGVDGPLDMRMDPNIPHNARQLLDRANYQELREWLRTYGEVRDPGRIAKAILNHRGKIRSTGDLKDLVARVVPPRYLKKNLSQVFQALRIKVNDELASLEAGLNSAGPFLKKRTAGRDLVPFLGGQNCEELSAGRNGGRAVPAVDEEVPKTVSGRGRRQFQIPQRQTPGRRASLA